MDDVQGLLVEETAGYARLVGDHDGGDARPVQQTKGLDRPGEEFDTVRVAQVPRVADQGVIPVQEHGV